MTPNLFLATQKVFQPHKWFRGPKATVRPTRVTEYWSEPEPGQYEYIPGRGWFKISEPSNTIPNVTDIAESGPHEVKSVKPPRPQEFVKLVKPIPVHRSRVLGRYLLEDEYKRRKVTTTIRNERGKMVVAGFFQLDNGVAWVQCWDENGTFIPGGTTGYKLWCIDSATKQFRHMRKGDDPNFTRTRNSSLNREVDSRSEDSISTAFRSNPGSTRDGPSVPSTRANSTRGPLSNSTSTPSSRAQSRRNSPRRNNSIPLEEAKAALRRMAKEHEEAVAAAAAARTRTNSRDTVERIERGRPMTRVAN
ncbi:hypothetical protein EK21DRAFT_118674 [Setomelanomma holmii]|uniref:Uncharacterized protein n=1 Tax=Setomelanomma holmii TaxID=210430 RepID=A0A9P4GVL5_9PLEO|nr:hypothetical protein EK21DRAFT_118674 [Setomelanomma holmii]